MHSNKKVALAVERLVKQLSSQRVQFRKIKNFIKLLTYLSKLEYDTKEKVKKSFKLCQGETQIG